MIIKLLLRIFITLLLVLTGLYYIYHSLLFPAKNAADSTLPYSDNGSMTTQLPIQNYFTNEQIVSGIALLNSTIHFRGSISTVLDSLEGAWSSCINDVADIYGLKSTNTLAGPVIERGLEKNVGFIGHTDIFMALKDSGDQDSVLPSLYVYNRTALASKRSDSDIVVNISEMSEPILITDYFKWLVKFCDSTSSSAVKFSCANATEVIKIQSNESGGGIYAYLIKGESVYARTCCLKTLEDNGWNLYSSNGEIMLFTRGNTSKETTAVSIVDNPKDSSTLLIVSYQGYSQPFFYK